MRIQIRNFTKYLKGKLILDHVNLEMEGARVYGFEGINGSGKTMLMRAVLGFLRSSEGRVELNGEEIGKRGTFPKNVGFLIENPAFLEQYTAKKNLQILAEISRKAGDAEIDAMLRAVDLDPDSKKVYKKFSLGMKQRLGIAAAFLEKPELVILDEPMNALDADGVERVKKLIDAHLARGGLCILSCHDRSLLEELTHRIFTIHEGKITAEREGKRG